MTTDDLLKEISVKLDKVIKLLAASAIKEYDTEQKKIELLDSMGFKSTEIAKILNKSIENVCVQLSLISKKKVKAEKNVPNLETVKATAQSVASSEEVKGNEPTGK
jgi:DNA-directed RNA polymerase specialized sigma24 family protein